MSRTFRKNPRRYIVFDGEVIDTYCKRGGAGNRWHRVQDYNGSVPIQLNWNEWVGVGYSHTYREVTVPDCDCFHRHSGHGNGIRIMYERIDRARAKAALHRALVDETRSENDFVSSYDPWD